MARRVIATCAQRVLASHAFGYLTAALSVGAAHPWVRAWRIAWRKAFAFLVGDSFEDELVAFSKRRLVTNDSYRDRLLAPEIADLVDLCEALQLSLAQRKAFFRCFLHLDYLRRAGVSRSELLRYCALRDTPAARVVLPSSGAFAVAGSAHRSDEFRTQRWDILQLLALCFSLCTMETATLLDLCIAEIVSSADTVASGPVSGADDESECGTVNDEKESPHLRLARQIEACLAFSFGTPSPVEKSLVAFLCRLYNREPLPHGKVDFMGVHGVTNVADIVALFPVLLFPCVWIQRVIRRRVLGDETWRKLGSRRQELHIAGLGGGFASVEEILASSKAHQDHRTRLTSRLGPTTLSGSAAGSMTSTPRKILPVADATHEPSDATGRAHSWFTKLQNEDDAWRVTADSVLATVFVWRQTCDELLTTQDAAALFDQTRRAIQSNTVAQASVASIQRQLVQAYGYKFTATVFAKSSIHDAGGELVRTVSVKKDLRRAAQRHRKADEGIPLVEDKAIYWKEYSDPVLKRVFYHNIRTGESRWEMPSTVLATRRKKRKRSPTKYITANRTAL